MKVLKFGGTSTGSPERIKDVKKIIESQQQGCVVVVSAFNGVTDELKRLFDQACRHNGEYMTGLNDLKAKHIDFARQLIDEKKHTAVFDTVDDVFSGLDTSLRSVFSGKAGNTPELLDTVVAAGEILSSSIISHYIDNCKLVDARNIIKTDSNFGCAEVDFAATNELIAKNVPCAKVTLLPGFIASDHNGRTTTLGRGGSDYTAAIIAAAISATALEIWTDVDGFMTADPKKVERAYSIKSLTYGEAIELSHFGAKVIYTPSLRPVYRKNIPVRVLNTFNPSLGGSVISSMPADDNRSPIKGISSIDSIDLITLQGTCMVGVTGTSMRLFSALARQAINVVLITQASSEYSITFAVTPEDSGKAVSAINEEFKKETGRNELHVHVENDLSIIAIVGEKMKNTPGISATLFSALGRNGISVIATAQGSSELNISVVIRQKSLNRAMNAIHDSFFLSRYIEMHLFVAGYGVVGSSLLKQLNDQAAALLEDCNLKINLMGITNSRKMVIDKKGIPLEHCSERLNMSDDNSDLDLFISQMAELNLRNSIFVDCTANGAVASKYADILSKYVSVVTANKIACSSSFDYYQHLKTIASEKGVRFIYETTVGAGLPVIKTINDLALSGDRILRIEAVLSGTINFIFNEIGPSMPLSEAIKKAREKGYSEPDPRIDLSGTDVVRKILILSREAGYRLEFGDVEIKKFLPEECFEGSLADFFGKVKEYDVEFEEKRKQLESSNLKWRFFATLDNGKAKVELLTIGPTHPAYNLEGSSNIISLTTTRYRELPMVIKGYGAGDEVTAAGVFADLMRVVNV
ncbi:MAG: bifunctional aspartate kinase/homoserine dehydrogenase I [Bacteroidales bacterium]|jgi:aspartokinase/homoserine dehydrogenase 1|nr:bifunctional aspartate kinase/homoserine dehydrogenase I [Bacteroidales bacterium]